MSSAEEFGQALSAAIADLEERLARARAGVIDRGDPWFAYREGMVDGLEIALRRLRWLKEGRYRAPAVFSTPEGRETMGRAFEELEKDRKP